MAQTVIGFFDSEREGREAIEKLSSAGISRDRIDVSEGYDPESGSTNVSSDRNHSDNAVTRFFKNLFGDDDNEADRYSRVGSSSRCVISVYARSEDEAERAADILDDCGAIDVDERSAQFSGTSGSRSGNSDRRDTSIPRVQENLEVGKRSVESGGVRVRSRIVERPVEEHVRLRQEHVEVERHPVNRPLTGNEGDAFRERTIELTERSEVPVVNKEARVVEEVNVSKNVTSRDETVRDTLRDTEIDVDRTKGRESGDRDSDRNYR